LDTKEKVRHQLSHIRNSLLQNSLSAVYQNELEQIKGQGQKERDLAIEAMTWIYHAERPMKTMELLDILDFRFSNSYSASPSESITISGVLHVCKGLLRAVLTTDQYHLCIFRFMNIFKAKQQTIWFFQRRLWQKVA
jgi:hypothetical protein